MARYLLQKVAKMPSHRRIKDTAKNRYVKQPHGDDIWPMFEAAARLNFLNSQPTKDAP